MKDELDAALYAHSAQPQEPFLQSHLVVCLTHTSAPGPYKNTHFFSDFVHRVYILISRHSQETRLLRCRRPSLPVYWKCVEKHLDSFALICSVYRGVSITASLMWPAARAPVCLLKPSSHRDPTQDSVLTLSHTIAVDLCTHSSLSCRDGGVSVNPPKGRTHRPQTKRHQ